MKKQKIKEPKFKFSYIETFFGQLQEFIDKMRKHYINTQVEYLINKDTKFVESEKKRQQCSTCVHALATKFPANQSEGVAELWTDSMKRAQIEVTPVYSPFDEIESRKNDYELICGNSNMAKFFDKDSHTPPLRWSNIELPCKFYQHEADSKAPKTIINTKVTEGKDDKTTD